MSSTASQGRAETGAAEPGQALRPSCEPAALLSCQARHRASRAVSVCGRGSSLHDPEGSCQPAPTSRQHILTSPGKQLSVCSGTGQGNRPVKPTDVCYYCLYAPCSFITLPPFSSESILAPAKGAEKSPSSGGYGHRYKFLSGIRFVPAPAFPSAEARSPSHPSAGGKSSVHSGMCGKGLSKQSPWELALSPGQSRAPGFGQQRTAASWGARAKLCG